MNRRSAERDGLMKRFCDFLGRQHRMAGLLDSIADLTVSRPAPRWALAADGPTRSGRAASAPSGELRASQLFMADGPGTEGKADMAPAFNPDNVVEPSGRHMPPPPDDGSRRPRPPEDLPAEPSVLSTILRLFMPGHTTLMPPLMKTRPPTQSTLKSLCAEPQYRGMFGKPCKLHGGTDTHCPEGTVSGWFWRYQTPVGVIYYVDCCGKPTPDLVICNWTREDTWCYGGKAYAQQKHTIYTCTLALPDAQMKTVKVNAGQKDEHLEIVGVD